MADKVTYYMVHPQARDNAKRYTEIAPHGWSCTFAEPKRSLLQNAKLHAIFSDVSRQKEFAGKKRTVEQWKVLFISGHSMATKQGAEMVPGIENEFVNIRESSAGMSIARLNSLIEYCLAYCALNDINLTETDKIPAYLDCVPNE